jgi:superfamily II DNA/RNA helicase
MVNFAIVTDDLDHPFPLGVDQYVLRVGIEEDKLGALVDILDCRAAAGADGDEQQLEGSPTIKGIAQAVIFCKSKLEVDWLFDRLVACNIRFVASPRNTTQPAQT